MQLRLLRPAPVLPARLEADQYVPCLQNRQGELKALRLATRDAWSRMRPLIEVVGPGPHDPDPDAEKLESWTADIGHSVRDAVIYLDVLRLDPTRPVQGNDGKTAALPHLYAAAMSQGIAFVPVMPAIVNDHRYVSFVAEAAQEDARGVAIRVPLQSFVAPAGSTLRSTLDKLCAELRCDPAGCDLLFDLGFLNQYDDLESSSILETLEELGNADDWRSIVLLGSSIPRSMGSIEAGTIGRLRRREWELWKSLQSIDLPRMPTFGDYAVQNPLPPASGGWTNSKASIRYTVEDATLVVRGEGPLRDAEQYRDMCRLLVERDDFSGSGYSEGDRVIHSCALGQEKAGWQSLWREVGTSHHLQVVCDQLRRWSSTAVVQHDRRVR